MRPRPLTSASDDELLKIRGICLDIDETLSTQGKLTAGAYAALWALKQSGFFIVPITGRPAGWCDHIARFWPVNAVVGENGAFSFFMKQGVRRRLDTPGAPLDSRAKLAALRSKIIEQFPWAKWASDQAYREFDLAIDVCEDVAPWPRDQVDKLIALCRTQGAHVKLSSIHVNAWFGDYDKQTGFKYWLSTGAPGVEPAPSVHDLSVPDLNEWLFIGDSPNDEPLFECFNYSVGVANLGRFIDHLKTPPKWLTEAESGEGFAEMAGRLLTLRACE